MSSTHLYYSQVFQWGREVVENAQRQRRQPIVIEVPVVLSWRVQEKSFAYKLVSPTAGVIVITKAGFEQLPGKSEIAWSFNGS